MTAGYLSEMDRLFSSACRVFPRGSAQPATPLRPGEGPEAGLFDEAADTAGGSGLSDGFTAAQGDYAHDAGALAAFDEGLDSTISRALSGALDAGVSADGVGRAARSIGEAAAGDADSPEGLGLLVHSIDGKLSAMEDTVGDCRADMNAAAAKVGWLLRTFEL